MDYGFTDDFTNEYNTMNIMNIQMTCDHTEHQNKAGIHQGQHGMFRGVIMFNSDFTANLVCSC